MGGADGRDLPIETVDQLRVIPTGDRQLRSSEQTPLDPDGSGVSFGVDDVHAGWRDCDVIDVPAAERHPSVVEDDGRALGCPLVEGLADSDLAELPSSERPLVLGRVGQPEQ